MSPQDRRHGREAARRRAAQAAAREEAKRRQRRMRSIIAGILAVVVVLAIVLALVPRDTTSKTSSSTTTSTSEAGPSTTKAPNVGPIADDPSETTSAPFTYGPGACPPAEKPATPVRSFTDAPQRCLKDGVDYKATFETSEGSFTVDLLEKRAPGTVNNFVVLARNGFFDGLTFHRVVPGFVIQGGDPKGDGSGGPGYTIPDELPTSVASYKQWAVAMANTGQPKSGGSQFFVCVDCSTLPGPGYSLFGQVTAGTDTVSKIDALGTGDGPPSKTVTITSVTILEG